MFQRAYCVTFLACVLKKGVLYLVLALDAMASATSHKRSYRLFHPNSSDNLSSTCFIKLIQFPVYLPPQQMSRAKPRTVLYRDTGFKYPSRNLEDGEAG
jgi:hypothetical protein